VYTTPLLVEAVSGEDAGDEIQEILLFLESFDLLEKTEYILELPEKHPDTLKAHYMELVPLQVSYKDFWQRFFYRCDEKRIENRIKKELAEQDVLGPHQAQAMTAVNPIVSVPSPKADVNRLVHKLETNRLKSASILKILADNKKALTKCKEKFEKSKERVVTLGCSEEEVTYPSIEMSVSDSEAKGLC
jgi:hypothetical protein